MTSRFLSSAVLLTSIAIGAGAVLFACSSDVPDTATGSVAPSADASADGKSTTTTGSDASAEPDDDAASDVADSGSDVVDADTDAATTDGGKPFGAKCERDDECATGGCFTGGQGGGGGGGGGSREAYCTYRCAKQGENAPDCPTPETTGSCNARLYCKK